MTEAERSQLQIMHYHDSVALRVQNSRQLFQIVIRKFGRDKTKLQVDKMKKSSPKAALWQRPSWRRLSFSSPSFQDSGFANQG